MLPSSALRLWLRQALPYGGALLLLLAVRQSRLSEAVNLKAYDFAVAHRPAPSGASTPVRLVGIDADDLRQFGDPVPDGVLAAAIRQLDLLGVRAIGLDLFRDRPLGPGTDSLHQLARHNPRLVSVTYEPDGLRAIPGTPPQRQGYADLFLDPQDGKLRRDVLFIDDGSADPPQSLAMRLLQLASGQPRWFERLRRPGAGLATLHTGGGGYLRDPALTDPAIAQRMLAFRQPGSFPTLSLRALLSPARPRDLARWRGAIVLIGVVAPSAKDRYSIPHAQAPVGDQLVQMPGVEIHAHRLAALLDLQAGRPHGIQPAPPWLNHLLLLLAAAIGLVLGERVGRLRRSQGLVAFTALLAVVATAVGLWLGLWLDAALPLAALVLLATAAWIRRGTLQETQRRRLEQQGQQMRRLFDRFLSHQVADALLAADSPAASPGELGAATVLMSDLRGFSLLSQRHDPLTIRRSLNAYIEAMSAVIEQHNGTLVSIAGDGIQVLFGVPDRRPDHGDAAVRCALAMQLAMEPLNRVNAARGLPRLSMGIGLCSGEVIAGAIGSSLRSSYSVVGETVNLASRIEALTTGGDVLASRSTVDTVTLPLRIDARFHAAPKGAAEPLEVMSLGAIGGPQPLALPAPDHRRTALRHPLALRYSIMTGKQREGILWPARLTHTGQRNLWIRPEHNHLQPLDNLLLELEPFPGEAYGKVRALEADGAVRVELSVMPEGLRDWLSGPDPP